MEFVPIEQTQQQLICPFCKGNEDETPPPFVAYREDGSLLNGQDDPSSWTVRVIPNKYPAFPRMSPGGDGGLESSVDSGPYQRVQMPGEQEVIVSSPRHVSSLSELSQQELHVSFRAYQDRIGHLQQLEHVQHAMLFMNCRHSAGASLSHIHTQLIGSPVVSGYLLGRSDRNDFNFENHGVTLIQSLTDWELKQETRMIYESDQFAVYCPYASRFAFQTWIVPKKNQQHYCECSPEMLIELSDLCRRLVARFGKSADRTGLQFAAEHGTVFTVEE